MSTWDLEIFSAHNKAKGHSYPGGTDNSEFIPLDRHTSSLEHDLALLSLERQQRHLTPGASDSESAIDNNDPRQHPANSPLRSIVENPEDSDSDDMYYNPPAAIAGPDANNRLPPVGPASALTPRPIATPAADLDSVLDKSANPSTSEETVAAVADAPITTARRVSTRIGSKSGKITRCIIMSVILIQYNLAGGPQDTSKAKRGRGRGAALKK